MIYMIPLENCLDLEMIEIQKRVAEATRRLNLASTPEICALDLSSEVGELAKEVLELTDYGRREHIYNPDLARELGDSFYSLIALANIYNISLEEQLEKSLRKYEFREMRRKAEKENIKVKLEPIVLAKNFLCLNAVAGCRNNCVYCYKHGWDIKNRFVPQQFAEVEDILSSLPNHRYFHPKIPLAIHNSATDPFQKEVEATTFKIMDGLEVRGMTNIVGLITKEYLPTEVINRLENYKNIRPVIFVTFSGLPPEYEKVVDERRLETMENLSKSHLPRILYYRPIIEGVNDSEKTIRRIMELGEKYFHCIVRSALKLDVSIVEYMTKRGLPVDSGYDIGLNIHDSLKQMSARSRARVDYLLGRSKVPYFKKTSCAISCLFNQPDYNCQWIRPEIYCSPLCPQSQKEICAQAVLSQPKEIDVQNQLQHLGLKVPYQINKDHLLIKSDRVFYSDVKYLRMALKFPVLVGVNGEALTAEEYDNKYVNADRREVRKLVKKMGIANY
ncbi:MAG: hypothetical protein UU73_C0001G0212 [Candidatus Daviesbacteria bacterium GW2011_GWA1_41_61]|uniref:NTP pyrophosphohydrolase MazG-like domain-containing protein n=1 Tax=Candidatus Daviesbacteria bacterium GW2011_GWA2_40_9 TaxID=1618424 RepID=A0A0G0WE72_9BACT|nr:MAG: hypothetical protein UU26_C0017G0008 [Candidatus Daviesbacteria bacterium GW2011_GWC1_40_9]KKR82580.1 MAG: hypothetical protein UU29_C0011G0027 [Candidatus Daviesbacteria bacterium GW2011_GWA2_40_9]KKR93031.1 MAG: hypothetical protein UU44_C0004G0213 [Candidatus Daviesbacteria bacterium GW2011_GWB1_41_15]KKS15575.1 MAG: hypothetical protein UU73_C0001G0212 [Candidatus Daviesbacteria bacterium GW2011_GWA1_41_61]